MQPTAANDNATIRLLLEKGANVNVKDPAGVTPLMNAAMNGNVKIAEMLIARGADVNAVSADTIGGTVKAGKIAMGSLTPLLVASIYRSLRSGETAAGCRREHRCA